MKQLTVNWSDLEDAMASAAMEGAFYLDLETGEVLLLSDESAGILRRLRAAHGTGENASQFDLAQALAEADVPEWQHEEVRIAAFVEEHRDGRCLQIPGLPSFEKYQTMVDFIETVPDLLPRELLAAAIDGRGAFRRFKDTLLRFPEERQRWFAFERRQRFAAAAAWLRDQGIEALNPPPE